MDYKESDTTMLSVGEKATFYGLCDSEGCPGTDPEDALTAYCSSLERAIEDFRQKHPSQDPSRLNLVRMVYYNDGPLGEYQAKVKSQETTKAMPIPEVEHPLRGTVGDVHNVFDTIDLIVTMTVEAIGHRLLDDDYPTEVQDEGLTLLTTVRYLQRLTERGHRLAFAQRQPDEVLSKAIR